MRKIPLLLLFVTALQFSSYSQQAEHKGNNNSQDLVDLIRYIKLAEVDETRTIVVKGLYFQGPNGPGALNYPLQQISANKSNSEIVITDTVGLLTSNAEVEIVPSHGGIDVIIDLNIRAGYYYCQNTTGGKMKTERGRLGIHRPLSSLTTIQVFSGSDHFATVSAYNRIIIYRYNSSGAAVEVARFSTNGQTRYVYRNNGNLVVAS